MNNAVSCPNDEQLVPMLAGETVDHGVESHVQSCTICRNRLDSFKSDLAALRSVMIQDAAAVAPPPARPARIGKYLVVGKLDAGGQAEVYRALHPTLETEVVIKLSRRGVGRLSENRHLLVAEGRLLAKLDHPGLARVFDLDFHEDQPFLAMEYVRGPNLRKFAEETPPVPRDAAALVAQVARALAVVHRNGIIHQDVKPQNILIDPLGRARLIDFGMARLRHAWDDSGEQVAGGTAAFMAPEQARDESTVGPRSDIFALGAVLYFLLTRRPPFNGRGVTETLALAGRCEFDRGVLDSPGIPKALREICLKAMAADPDRRFGTADELAEALEHFVSRPQRIKRLTVVGVGALAILGVGYCTWVAFRPSPVAAPIVAPPTMDMERLQVLVSRGGETLNLAAAVPLDPIGDRFQIIGRVSSDQRIALYHVNAKGKVKRLEVRESSADTYRRVAFPSDERLAALDAKLPGTEFILAATANDPKDFEGLEETIELALAGVPAMDPKTVITLTRDEPRRETRGLNPAEVDPAAVVEIKLDQLRRRLAELPLSNFQGVAYSRK